MQYLTAATILSSALLASAAPATLDRRACQVAYPQSIGFPINYHISQDASAANKVDNFITFSNVPAGSYGCQLEVNFPAAYPIAKSGNSRVDVYSVSSGSLVGTLDFTSSPVAPTRYVINSFACEASMGYRMTISSATDAGSVAFADTKDAGITMTYNC